MKFEDVTEIKANHPYIIRTSAAISEFAAEGVDVAPEESPTNAVVKRTKKAWSEMIGTYVAGTEPGESCLILNGNMFWYTTEATKVKAFRAYFDFYDEIANKETSSARVSFDFDAATAISNVERKSLNPNIYTISGQQVMQTRKGLYIQNGKKYVVK